MQSLRKAQLECRFSERLKKYYGYRLLIIDELCIPANLKGWYYDSKLFFQLIGKRYERNSTVITTNISFAQWDEILGDPLITNAINNRLLHHATMFAIKGKSYHL